MGKKVFVFTAAIIFTVLLFLLSPNENSKQFPASFVRDTPVQTPGGPVRIEDLAEGDMVLSYNLKSGEWTESKVIKASSVFYDIIAMTTISLQNEEIRCTGNHPVYVTKGDDLKKRLLERSVLNQISQGWVMAGDLRSGDKIISSSGENQEIINISTVFHSSLLFDLELADMHNFGVGITGILAGDLTLVPDNLFEPVSQPNTSVQGSCFPAGTPIEGEQNKFIENIRPGDKVRSYNPDSGNWGMQKVLNNLTHEYSGTMVKLIINGESLEVTVNHSFFVISGRGLHSRKRPADFPGNEPVNYTYGRWVEAGDLLLGDTLISFTGTVKIDGIDTYETDQTVYNIEVSDSHTYSAGRSGVAVHNKGQAESMDMELDYSPMSSEEMISESAAEDFAPIVAESEVMEKKSIADISQSQEEKPAPDQLFLSADDSNSCASPVIVRNIINNGRYVHPSLIRTYEFYNYYNFGYPAPEEGDLGVYANMHDEGDGVFSIQAVLRSPDRTMENLPPFNIVFLLDSSGSMAGEPWALSREFVYRYIDFLRPGDTFAIVTVDRYAEVLIDKYQVNSGAASYAKRKLEKVIPDDITNLDPGITLAYEIAESFHNNEELTRVIFVSDGGANAGDYSGRTVSGYAADGDSQGIYLTGVGVGSGFNDGLMNMLTDSGRGAYFFLDTQDEIDHILDEFLSYFDLAYKNVRLGMQMPPGWDLRSFHGEQISTVREDIVPQYLAPNDQMIFHMELNYTGRGPIKQDKFTFEAEFTPIGAEPDLAVSTFTVEQMTRSSSQLMKANAITVFAEGLKTVAYPLELNRIPNLKDWDIVIRTIGEIQTGINDSELEEIIGLARSYRKILDSGEQFPDSADLSRRDIPGTLGIPDETVLDVIVEGSSVQQAIRSIERLGSSVRLQATEGYRFLGLSSGPVGNPQPVGSGQLSNNSYKHPHIEYMGRARYYTNKTNVYDLHKISLRLKAPAGSESFSFDLNYFSAEYPDFVNQNFNDSFYAILQAQSTNQGIATNISFDPDQNPLEVDNNYFQRRFHPIPNNGTGFDNNGSTGWLRTSWPIKGGEEFTLTFTIHDEGDAIYDSLVLLDNFKWHDYPAVGNTDPLN
jgi:Ca-activated chloride channel homolog